MRKHTPKTAAPHRNSLQWQMIGIMLICWLIPLAFLIGILGVYLAGNHSDMTAQNFRDQLEFNNQNCVERLNGAVAASRQASYDGVLLEAYQDRQAGRVTPLTAGKRCKDYLTARYQKDDAIACAVLWFGEEEELYSVYNERAKGSFQQIRSYQEEEHGAVREYARKLGTKVGFVKGRNQLYLVRNLVDSHFQAQGTLVLFLNQSYCFDSLREYPMADGACAEIGGEALTLAEGTDQGQASAEGGTSGDAVSPKGVSASGGILLELLPQERLREWVQGDPLPDTGYEWLGDRLCVSDDQTGDNYTLHTAMLLQKEVTKYPFYGYQYVLAGVLACLVPMLLLMIWEFRRKVAAPLETLSEGARHIENGELGYQVEDPMGSLELSYLRDAFNQMSGNLKQQFDRIYQEEIALREARIMALQSHINPHFMNNTLEIINWEARLGGNEKVSKMIGALSTMLDAAMDRRNRPLVRLQEEMTYVNAYLYITRERLGKRLTVEMEIPEELMDDQVPRLILQPVVENAVEHGVVPGGSGTVWIRGRAEESRLYLEVVNDGGMTEEDRQRIARLLAPDYRPEGESSGNLGIANVNQRLRILYGEPCGLTLGEDGEGRVVAVLTMPLQV